jgi:hypothetical protein
MQLGLSLLDVTWVDAVGSFSPRCYLGMSLCTPPARLLVRRFMMRRTQRNGDRQCDGSMYIYLE